MGRSALLGIFSLGVAAIGSIAWSGPPAPTGGKLIVVKMVDVSTTSFKFEPANIIVAPGDTVRFEQTGPMPHNVEFREIPTAAALGEAKTGPYLVAAGQVYDLAIDARFIGGDYRFVCVPHESVGMKGTLSVARKK